MAWLSGYGFRKEITILDGNVDGNLTDFPAYVDITTDADIGDETRADGYDIRFTEDDGETLLKYEREYWTGGAGDDATGHFWVKVPSILATGGATIYCYYGDADAADGEDAANVWDANFAAVYHLKESGDASADEFKDSSGNANHGQGGGGDAGQVPSQIDGKIYKGNYFDGVDEFIYLPPIALGGKTGTLSAWVKHDSGTGTNAILSRQAYQTAIYSINATDEWKTIWVSGGSAAGGTFDTDWHLISATYDGTLGSVNLKLFEDDTQVGTDDDTADIRDELYHWEIGAAVESGYWTGIIDEVRLSSSTRLVAWIKFEYANINEDDNELTWGGETTETPVTWIPQIIMIT